jgi:hypothetical protein
MASGNNRRPLWQIETEIYVPRIAKAQDLLAPPLAECRKLPTAPFSHEPSLEEQLVYSIALFAWNGTIVVDQLIDNIGLLWSQGRMVGVSGLARFAVEYWGAVYFGRKILIDYMADKNLEEAVRKGARLTFSAKTPVRLWWGGESTNPAYSVMTFIDALSAVRPDIKAMYDFLSEASHPNFVQNTYFVMASRVYDNFGNDTFKAYAHEILQRTISIIEHMAEGLAADVIEIVTMARPFFLPDEPA